MDELNFCGRGLPKCLPLQQCFAVMNLKQELNPPLQRIHGQEVEGLDLPAAIARLDLLVREHGNAMDPHLRHYLQQRSYGKALDWLKAEEN